MSVFFLLFSPLLIFSFSDSPPCAKRTLGRSNFVRLAENDLLIAEKTSSVGVLRSLPISGFSVLEKEDSYGRRLTCSVGRVFRPPRVETTWESEKASVDRVTVSAGESDVLPRFIEKRRSFIDDYYRQSLRNTISRVGTPVANNSVSLSRYSSSPRETAFSRSLAFRNFDLVLFYFLSRFCLLHLRVYIFVLFNVECLTELTIFFFAIYLKLKRKIGWNKISR